VWLVPVPVPLSGQAAGKPAGQWHGRMGHGQQEHRPASACHWACTVVHWGTARGVKKAGGLVRVVKAWVKAKGRGVICCVVCCWLGLLHSVAHRVKHAHCSHPIMKSCATCMNNTGHPTGYSRMLRFHFISLVIW
jgi:hypothetical protein